MSERVIFVPGIPQSKGNVIRSPQGHYRDVNNKVRPWIADIVAAIHEAGWEPLEGPVALRVSYIMPRPKKHFGTGRNADVIKNDAPEWHTSKPDGDKLERAIFDALTKSGVIADDSRIARWGGAKVYSNNRETGVLIRLYPLAVTQ
jgi:crossover junction endodeoxyribonuclease RusA